MSNGCIRIQRGNRYQSISTVAIKMAMWSVGPISRNTIKTCQPTMCSFSLFPHALTGWLDGWQPRIQPKANPMPIKRKYLPRFHSLVFRLSARNDLLIGVVFVSIWSGQQQPTTTSGGEDVSGADERNLNY